MTVELSSQQIVETKAWRDMGLTDAEFDRIVEQMGRLPNWTELGMYAVLWSEHCAYKHSRGLFHLFPTEGEQILQGPGENAGIVDLGDGLAAVFKVESHNSPSAVEPYQGAATGVGGILRDIFTMGARPVAVLNSLRFGSLDDEHVRYLFAGVVSGISGYGNAVGVPTVGGEVAFDPSYRGNPLVNAMAVGIVEHEYIARGNASGVGNPVMVVGARTGRDGIHGASFSSAELDDDTEVPTIQVGDPFTEKLLIEACLELIQSGVVIGIQDMGAAGLTSSAAEMASRAGSGIEMDVLKVPHREEGMTPYEFMLSESQERMLVVPKRGSEDKVAAIFEKWGLEAAVIGRVTDDGMLRVMEGDRIAAEVPVASIVDGAPRYEPAKQRPAYLDETMNVEMPPPPQNYAQTLLDLLASPTIASKEWVYRQYDHTLGAATVVGPGEGDAAVLRIRGTKKGLAMTIDCNQRYVYLNPRRGAQIAVAEAARNISCVGAKPLAITDGMNFGNPEKPEVFWQFDQAVRGISEACAALNTPVTGGNVSFYNEKGGQAIHPTPMIGMIGLLDDVEKRVGMGWCEAGHRIILLGENRNELGASEYLALRGIVGGDAPELDLEREAAVQALVRALIADGMAVSAHDCADGGLAVALAESCIASGMGATVAVEADFRADALLFGETQSRIVISVAPEHVAEVERRAQEAGVPFTVLGETGGDSLTIDVGATPDGPGSAFAIALEELERAWRGTIPRAMEGEAGVAAYLTSASAGKGAD